LNASVFLLRERRACKQKHAWNAFHSVLDWLQPDYDCVNPLTWRNYLIHRTGRSLARRYCEVMKSRLTAWEELMQIEPAA